VFLPLPLNISKVVSGCLLLWLYYLSFARDKSLALASKILNLTEAVGSDSGEIFLGAGLCSCDGIICLISEKEINSCTEFVECSPGMECSFRIMWRVSTGCLFC